MVHTATKQFRVIKDFKALSSFLRSPRTVAFVYGFALAFVVFTVFLAFNPFLNTSTPSFSSIFDTTATTTDHYRSQASSFFSYMFPTNNSTTKDCNFTPVPVQNTSLKIQKQSQGNSVKSTVLKRNSTVKSPIVDTHIIKSKEKGENYVKVESLKSDHFKKEAHKSPALEKVVKANSSKSHGEEVVQQRYKGDSGVLEKKGMEKLVKCDLFDGQWVMDKSYPLYKPGSCSLVDEQFNCILNGRPDKDYQKYKWQPNGCNLPRLNASRMLNMLRGKQLVFVGDSLNRNMWESLVCILKSAAKNQKNVFEANGRQSFRGEASYSFIFKDYKFTVEFFVTPFLVQEWEVVDKNGSKKETLRLDLIGKLSEQYKDADIIVFNTGHWWTHEKTSMGENYYQEGSHVYKELNVLEAFRKALTTWGRWVDSNVNPTKSQVFFRGYSASHFSGGQWNSGGACDNEVEPIKNTTYLTEYPSKMVVLEKVLKGMKTNVKYLNITRMTDYRKDGHPSVYRKLKLTEEEKKSPLLYQDCSHWCLPGVPDTWNEILYSGLLIKEYQKKLMKMRYR